MYTHNICIVCVFLNHRVHNVSQNFQFFLLENTIQKLKFQPTKCDSFSRNIVVGILIKQG